MTIVFLAWQISWVTGERPSRLSLDLDDREAGGFFNFWFFLFFYFWFLHSFLGMHFSYFHSFLKIKCSIVGVSFILAKTFFNFQFFICSSFIFALSCFMRMRFQPLNAKPSACWCVSHILYRLCLAHWAFMSSSWMPLRPGAQPAQTLIISMNLCNVIVSDVAIHQTCFTKIVGSSWKFSQIEWLSTISVSVGVVLQVDFDISIWFWNSAQHLAQIP